MTEINCEQARFNMIEQQIRPWEVIDQQVLNVLAVVPREAFVPPQYRALAFADLQVPLGFGQVMMRPSIEGRVLQAIALQSHEHVLEVGTGSGYLTACLAHLCTHVVSVDIFPEFTQSSGQKLAEQGIRNVHLETGNAATGWGTQCYDAIVITGALPRLPPSWLTHLPLGGRLFAIIGQEPIMEARLITRIGEHELTTVSLFETMIPPLLHFPTASSFAF